MLAIVNMTLLLNIYMFLDISNLFYPRIIPYFACFYLPLHSQIPLFRRDNAFCLTFLLQFFQNQFICLIYHGIVQGSEINLRSIFRIMSHAFAYYRQGNVLAFGYTRP